MRSWLVAALLASPLAADAAPCVDADTDPVLLDIQKDKLRLCEWNGLKLSCATVDLGNGKWAAATPPPDSPRPRVVPPPRAPKVQIEDTKVSVCKADGSACKTLAPQGKPDPGIGMDAKVNEAGTLAALSYYADKTWVETFDPTTGKRIARFSVGSKKAKCANVDVLGDAILVTESECGSPGSKSWLATKTGKKLGDVAGVAHAPAGGSSFAFVSTAGDKVAFVDVTNGKTTKEVSLGAASDSPATMLTDFRRLVVVWGGKRAGDVASIDLSNDKVATFPGTRCP